MRSNESEIVILLGHGSSRSFCELTAEELSRIPNVKLVWIYACNCGVELVHALTQYYPHVVGHATTVLAPKISKSSVAHTIRRIIAKYDGDLNVTAIVAYVQEELFKEAKQLLETARAEGQEYGLYLYGAAMYNQVRLSLRIGAAKTGIVLT